MGSAFRVALNEALRAFTRREPTLVLADPQLERDTDVRLEPPRGGAGLRVVILDACREQPAGAVDAADGSEPARKLGAASES